MATWQSSLVRRRKTKPVSRLLQHTHTPENLAPRSLQLEPCEERLLFAINPHLVAVYTSEGVLLSNTLTSAPRELTLRFDADINPNTLLGSGGIANIQVTRGGADKVLGTADDVFVVPAYYAMGDNANEIVVRFAQTSVRQPFTLQNGTQLTDNVLLDPTTPDDQYRITVIGAGATPLKGTNGLAFNNGVNVTQNFNLSLAAQVVSVVPQPISRSAGGQLTQAVNQVDVYFNANDPLDQGTATTKTFYQLIRTTDQAGAPVTQSIVNPTSVTYNAATGKAVLTFADGVLSAAGSDRSGIYRLRIGTSEPLPLATDDRGFIATAGNTLSTAQNFGTVFTLLQGTQTIMLSDRVNTIVPQVLYPGGDDEPGVRNIVVDSHYAGGSLGTVVEYNFKNNIGSVLGSPAFNNITPEQKQRAREVLSYYSYYLGVSFIETESSGFTIATGDPRVVDPSIPPTAVGGIAGGGLAVMNSAVNWGNSEPGGGYFTTAMHEIGHILGLGHSYELPPLSVQGSSETIGDSPGAEPVFPGDSDILLGQKLYPPMGNDVNFYKFALSRAGVLNLETFSERLRDLNPNDTPSQLDSVISLYDVNGNLLARNDDYYGNDSFLQLALGSGTYYVAVTSTGNTEFDPTIANTGFGGTTAGGYKLKMSFTPTVNSGIRDVGGSLLDGDSDGTAGGAYNFFFRVAEGDGGGPKTIFVDKAAPTGGVGAQGSITNPFTTIVAAMAQAAPQDIVRIVGNAGSDGNAATLGDNKAYAIGFDNLGSPLPDGSSLEVPRDVTVMIDAGAIIKLRAANLDVGTSVQGINRSGGSLQVLGVPTGMMNTQTDPKLRDDVGAVYFTSYYKSGIGTGPTNLGNLLQSGNWGGLVFRNDPSLRVAGDRDLEKAGIFLNSVINANISYGGGKVSVSGEEEVYASVHLVTARPTISHNTITNSADAAVSADPNSFEESSFRSVQFEYDYTRSGPKVNGNTLNGNTINGLFVRVKTDESGVALDLLTTSARFSTTDMVYVIKENLLIGGSPGGFIRDASGNLQSRPNARLAIDPGVIVKLGGARIETQIGAQLLAEGTAARPIIFTSEFDDRFGAGGTYDTTNDNAAGNPTLPSEGDWGGLFFGPLSNGSVDHALITFAGGSTTIEGGFATFNPIEIHQASVRLTNSRLEHNDAPGGDNRNGRSSATAAVIFVRGAQPVIVNNIIQNNATAPSTDPNNPYRNVPAISVNVNALNFYQVSDWGRSTGALDLQATTQTNLGPLVRGNRLANNPINGMLVRGGTITTNVVWDDTDIVHVLFDEVAAGNQFSVLGGLRLQSTANESLVVKLLGSSAGITASGTALDIDDRIGGTVQVVGTPNHPVIMTSLFDNTVGAGFTPKGQPQTDTRNVGGAIVIDPLPTNSGPVFLDGGDRDDNGASVNNTNTGGWKLIEQAINFAYNNSRNLAGEGLLVIGVQTSDEEATQAQRAIAAVASQLGLFVTYVKGTEISSVNFSQFRVIYVPSDEFNTAGGITNADLARLAGRRSDIANFINISGGGLVALTEANATNPYSWLALPEPFAIQQNVGLQVVQTPAMAAAGFNISDAELSAGTPWRNNFVGPPGFNRLVPWAIDPNTGLIVTLGTGAGDGGIGARGSDASAGDWRSIKLDTLSNDTNVDYVNELEEGWAATGDINNLPTAAQFLGSLAKDVKSGDDNLRLGFEIHGSISQVATSQRPTAGDVDVYSFRATAGTAVWIDIDKTAQGLDSVIEIVDANGALVARNDNSLGSFSAPNFTGLAKPLAIGGPFSTPDYYSSNPLDAGMRLDLPGTAGTTNTYFVRVRASSSTLDTLTAGTSRGAYQLQIRLTQLDVFPGSTVRNADLRFATTGIDVIGKPERSPLMGDTGETSLPHNTIQTAQNLGNFLKTDSGALSVAGNLSAPGQVDWYKFDLNYDLIQAIGGVSDGANPLATMFQINYADGLARPDTTLSVFDSDGHLVYLGTDSDVPDSQPRGSLGSDPTNLGHGTYGPRDATIGSVELDAGSPQRTDPFTGEPTTTNRRYVYYVAVSAMNTLPTILDSYFQATATNPLVRLAPISTVTNIAQDSIGNPETPDSQKAFPGTTPVELNQNAWSYGLGDVVAYVNTSWDLYTVNPFTGQMQTAITAPNMPQTALPNAAPNGAGNRIYADIAMRSDGRLFTFPQGTGQNFTAATNGTYVELDPATGAVLGTPNGAGEQSAPMPTSEVSADTPIDANGNYTFETTEDDFGIAYNAMTFRSGYYGDGDTFGVRRLWVVGNRAPGVGIRDNQTQNLLFRLDPDTAQPFEFDLQSNRTDDLTIYQPFGATTTRQQALIGPGTGTEVIPRGTLDTGVYFLGMPATDPNGAYDRFGNVADILDGTTFNIFNRVFEFDLGAVLNLDDPDVPGLGGIASLRDGMGFAVTGPPANLPQTELFQLKSGPVLDAVGSGASMLGKTFSISDGTLTRTFEFGTAAQVAPGNVPVAIGPTPATVAANIVTAINVTAKQSTPAYAVVASLPSINSTRVSLTGDDRVNGAVDVSGTGGDIVADGDWNVAVGRTAVFFEETAPIATVADNIVNAVNNAPSFLGGSVKASFSRDRISFLGAIGINFDEADNVSDEISQVQIGGTSGTNVRVAINAFDSALQVSTAVRNAINAAGVLLPLNPGQVPPQTFAVNATLEGNNVKLSGADFGFAFNSPLKSDGSGDITGIALLPRPLEPGDSQPLEDMFAVSETGAIYRVDNYGSFFGSSGDNAASLTLLNVVEDEFGSPVQFTGLSPGPQNVEGSRYLRTLFATDIDGNIWAFDENGQPAPVFTDGRSRVSTGFFGLQGITFSTLDQNLWHAENDGRQVNRQDGLPVNDAGHTGGGSGDTTFYFGLTQNVGNNDDTQPRAVNYNIQDPDNLLSGNEAVYNSYNMPGGALGSLATQEFDFSDYSSADKPTLYFNYLLDTENDNSADAANTNGDLMTDSFRVYASADGANWKLLGTNNSLKTDNNAPAAPNRELPRFPLLSGGAYQNDRANQAVQELFDPLGNLGSPRVDAVSAATIGQNWRQARIDLGDFAGKSNVQIRFDFSTAGSLGIGNILQGGVYLAGVDASMLTDGQTFVVDNRRETARNGDGTARITTTNYDFRFRSGYVLTAPTGGGTIMVSGETFTVSGSLGTRTFRFRENTDPDNPPGVTPILFSDAQTPAQIATAMEAAINSVSAQTGVTTVRVGSKVQLVGATALTQSVGAKITVQGTAVPATPARTDIVYKIDMTAEQIATLIATAMDKQFAAINGASYLQAPSSGSKLSDGQSFTVTGPAGSTTYEFDAGVILSLDNASTDNVNGIASLRDQMVFSLTAPPATTPIVANYELKSGPVLNVNQLGSALTGQFFSIRDANGLNVVYEFGTAAQVQPGRVPVATSSSIGGVAANIVTAINVAAKALFPAYQVTAGRTALHPERVTLTGDQQVDTAVVTTGSPGVARQGTWALQNPGNIAIRFEETESVDVVAARIAAAVNATPGFAGQVLASVGGSAISFSGVIGSNLAVLDAASSEITTLGEPGVAFGSVPVPFAASMNSAQIAAAIAAVMNANPVVGVDVQAIEGSVLIINATSVSQSRRGGSLIFDFSTGGFADALYLRVAEAVADDPNLFTASKQYGRTLRVYGHNIVSAGGLPSSSSLEGDQNGSFSLPGGRLSDSFTMSNILRRAQNNAHEGVMIDDVIIGFAGRGEQVLGGFNPDPLLTGPTSNGPHAIDPENLDPLGLAANAVTTFTPLPFETVSMPTRTLTGAYQLTIRRGDDTQSLPVDINHRFTEGQTLYAPPASQLAIGQTFSITVEIGTFTFEFTNAAGAAAVTAAGRFPVVLPPEGDATAVAKAIRDAINNVPANRVFTVKAGLNVDNPAGKTDRSAINLFGALIVNSGPLELEIFGIKSASLPVLGDMVPARLQGQTIISGNKISDTLRAGVAVTPNLTPSGVGVPGRTGSVLNLPVLNNARLVPGIAIKNNLIVDGEGAGVLFTGSPASDIANAVPFGRIVNNTIANMTAGIRVANNASPTILNNALYGNGIAISVDGTSTSTIVGANIYQLNGSNLSGVSQTNPIVLAPGAPLFVDPANRNFYLKLNSTAIDSSVDVVPERQDLASLYSSIGIAASPILAPDVDIFGQLRIDDPNVQSPSGVGGNVFKDRGAVERSDFTGPTAALYNPVDNDPAGVDRNGAVNSVLIVGKRLGTFDIQLSDGGPGIDNTTVNASKFVVQRTLNGVTTTLVPDTDYTLAYDATNKIARIVPIQGVWGYATYTILLANATSGSPIKDLAGNDLRANDASQATKFVIQQSETPVSPWQNQTNKFDVNANGVVNGLDALLVINRLLLGQVGTILPGTPAPPYIDVSGDGVLSAQDAAQVIAFINSNPVGGPLAQSLTSTTDTEAAPMAVMSADTIELAAAAPQMVALSASSISAATLSTSSLATASAVPTSELIDTSAVVMGLALSDWSDDDGESTHSAVGSSDGTTGAIAQAQASSAGSSAGQQVAASLSDDELGLAEDDWDDLLDELANDTHKERVLV